MAAVSWASRRLRKIGAVPVFGLTRAKSSAEREKRRPSGPEAALSSSETLCRKKAHWAGCALGDRPATKAQNLKEA